VNVIHTLTVCMGVWLGLCQQIIRHDFPTYEACDRERAAIYARGPKPHWATCAPKTPPAEDSSK
jgi:hypothetical protein